MSKNNHHHNKPKQLPKPQQQVRHDVMTDAEKRKAQYDAIRDIQRRSK